MIHILILCILFITLPVVSLAAEFRSKNCPFVAFIPDSLGTLEIGESSNEAAFGLIRGKDVSIDIACGINFLHTPIPEDAEIERRKVISNFDLLDYPQELLNFQYVRKASYALVFYSALEKTEPERIALVVNGYSDPALLTMVIIGVI